MCHWPKYEHIEGFLPNQILEICLNFQHQHPLKNQYLSHLGFKNYEINSMNLICQIISKYTTNAPKLQYSF
jgi:hypothetical protein